jgi:hypothetical protein
MGEAVSVCSQRLGHRLPLLRRSRRAKKARR